MKSKHFKFYKDVYNGKDIWIMSFRYYKMTSLYKDKISKKDFIKLAKTMFKKDLLKILK